jgi:hypothetical protein
LSVFSLCGMDSAGFACPCFWVSSCSLSPFIYTQDNIHLCLLKEFAPQISTYFSFSPELLFQYTGMLQYFASQKWLKKSSLFMYNLTTSSSCLVSISTSHKKNQQMICPSLVRQFFKTLLPLKYPNQDLVPKPYCNYFIKVTKDICLSKFGHLFSLHLTQFHEAFYSWPTVLKAPSS